MRVTWGGSGGIVAYVICVPCFYLNIVFFLNDCLATLWLVVVLVEGLTTWSVRKRGIVKDQGSRLGSRKRIGAQRELKQKRREQMFIYNFILLPST